MKVFDTAPVEESDRLIVRLVTPSDVPLVLEFLKENQAFLTEWEPRRGELYLTHANIEQVIQGQVEEQLNRRGFCFCLFNKATGALLGQVNLSNIVYGVFLSCHLGYKVGEKFNGQGFCTEGVRLVVGYAFEVLGLHRVEANVMPRNERSRRVLHKLGFVSEGLSRRYLKINGVWEDHERFVVLNDDS